MNFAARVTRVEPSATLAVSNNELRNNAGSGIQVERDASSVVIRRNVISGNEIGVENVNQDMVLDARENYWGASDGPSSHSSELQGGEQQSGQGKIPESGQSPSTCLRPGLLVTGILLPVTGFGLLNILSFCHGHSL